MSEDAVPASASFPPVEPDGARVLILGTLPGSASLAAGRYYANPRNAFWPILTALFVPPGPDDPCDPRARAAALSREARMALLHRHGIALWDVIAQARRPGSLDSAIDTTSVVPNDIPGLLARQPTIERIVFNGAGAEQLFRRHITPCLPPEDAARPRLRLPSTSPAHATRSFDEKCAAWREALQVLQPPPAGAPTSSVR